MAEFRVEFIGLLSNSDKSILEIKLPGAFEITSIKEEEAIALLSQIAIIPEFRVRNLIDGRFCVLNKMEDTVYCVRSYYETDINPYEEFEVPFMMEMDEFEYEDIMEYLDPAIDMLRVYKEGAIFMPLSYYYYVEKGIINRIAEFRERKLPSEKALRLCSKTYTVDPTEIDELNKFVNFDTFTFSRPLQLAFKCFNTSYYVDDNDLAYLSIIMGLESLICDSEGWRKETFAQRLSSLIGMNEGESKIVNNTMIELYKKRSRIVHYQGDEHADEDSILQARDYLRRAIKEFIIRGMNKTEILKELKP